MRDIKRLIAKSHSRIQLWKYKSWACILVRTCEPVAGEVHIDQGQSTTPSWQCACTTGGWCVADGQ